MCVVPLFTERKTSTYYILIVIIIVARCISINCIRYHWNRSNSPRAMLRSNRRNAVSRKVWTDWGTSFFLRRWVFPRSGGGGRGRRLLLDVHCGQTPVWISYSLGEAFSLAFGYLGQQTEVTTARLLPVIVDERRICSLVDGITVKRTSKQKSGISRSRYYVYESTRVWLILDRLACL